MTKSTSLNLCLDVCWEVVDEVYLFEDDNQRTLSTTRFKILTLGFFETIGGIALVTSAVPGIMGNVVGKLKLNFADFLYSLRMLDSSMWSGYDEKQHNQKRSSPQ